ncbi:MAG: hypothetical protein ACI4EF_08175 [Coprococcus sp.]
MKYSNNNTNDIFDDDIDYSVEWEDLTSVYELTLSEDDNYTDDKFKVYTYQLILNQIILKANTYSGYVESSKLYEMIDNIETQLNGELQSVVQSSYDEVFETLLDTARARVNSAVTGPGNMEGDN